MDHVLINKAIEKYNMYRSPEAMAKLLMIGEEGFVVEFSGAFCRSCGVRDWLEDLIYELREIDPGADAELVNWEMTSDERIIAEFKMKAASKTR
ncbi:MAG: hypothetical protein N3F65_00795 [Nitrososphaeria archaeon]|nr:hypothetical protein [Aigarchaeota archaeon]MCX8187134.1 hypothetical protein [Nitrososphaeria archaeon]